MDAVKLEKVGLVASPSGETEATCILQDGMETEITTETLTALPETIIAVLSPFHGSREAMLVGMGSVLAAPSITLLLAAPLVILFWNQGEVSRLVACNYVVFAVFITVAVASSLAGLGVFKYLLAVVFLVSYLYLARSMLVEEGELMELHGESLMERLVKLRSSWVVLLQVFLASAGLIFGADLFIDSAVVFVNPFILTLLVSPIATCLEEVLVAFYWTIKKKADIAISLLSGENLTQSTLVVGVGMLFTEWRFPISAATIVAVYVLAAVLLTLFLTLNKARISAFVMLLYPLYFFSASL